jgi:hypothetical protein
MRGELKVELGMKDRGVGGGRNDGGERERERKRKEEKNK